MAGVTPDVRLLQAAQTGDLASAGAALAAGANLECTDSQFRKTPLALAVKFGQPDVARLLVQCGADTSLVQTGNPEVAAVLHETPPILARNAPLALWLRKVGLASFRHALVCRLGVAGVDDLLRLTEADLEAVGMKVAERRRFLAEAAKGRSAPAGPHADWTKEQVGAWLESEAFGDCVAALAPLRGLSLRGLTDEDLAQLRYPPIPRAVRRELLAAIAALP